jgi:hypothetical protein
MMARGTESKIDDVQVRNPVPWCLLGWSRVLVAVDNIRNYLLFCAQLDRLLISSFVEPR